MAQMVINYGTFNDWAAKFKNYNDLLLDDLHEIQSYIHDGTMDEWISDSAMTTRDAIIKMEGTFQQYYDVVQNYVVLIRNTAQQYQAAERANNSNAQRFL